MRLDRLPSTSLRDLLSHDRELVFPRARCSLMWSTLAWTRAPRRSSLLRDIRTVP